MRWICTFVFTVVMTSTVITTPSIAKADNQVEGDTDRTMRHAVLAYTEHDYTSAFAQMQQYLPLASADAAYYLGLMSINEQGTDYNPVSSLAYLQAAIAWKHPEAHLIADQIEPHLTTKELVRVAEELEALQQQVEVPLNRETFEKLDIERPERTRSRAPGYPRTRAMNREETWLTLMQVVSPEGKVITAMPIEKLPRDFMREYHRIESYWRYEPVEKPYPLSVRLSFSIDKASDDEYELINEVYERSYKLAMAGVPEQQMYLTLLASARGGNIDHQGLDEILQNSRDWLERAARGGYLSAQRYLAIHSQSDVWSDYLISQGDLLTMAFYGLSLYTFAAEPELSSYGEELIRKAAAAGNENAKAILPHL